MDWFMKAAEKELLHSNKLLDAANKKIDELKQALDEKDQKIQQLAGMCLIHEDVEKQLRIELAEKDNLIARLKATNWNENVKLLAESKTNLLQQYNNLSILYGEQKHKIRNLEAQVTKKDQAYNTLLEQVTEFAQCLVGCPSPCSDRSWSKCTIRKAEALLLKEKK